MPVAPYDESGGAPGTPSNPLEVAVTSGPTTIADGADVAEGATTDAAVAAGAAGTISAKLRRLTTDLAALLAKLPASLGGSGGLLVQQYAAEGTFLASAARTATPSDSADIPTYGARGIRVWLNVTAASGTGGLIPRVLGKDPVSGVYQTLHSAPTGIIATGMSTYAIAPGSSGGDTQNTQNTLPPTIKLRCTHGDGSSYTYSIGYSLLP